MNTNQSTGAGQVAMSLITILMILLVSGFLIPDAWIWLFDAIIPVFQIIGGWFAAIGSAIIHVVTLRWL
jgi:hypothetical protein